MLFSVIEKPHARSMDELYVILADVLRMMITSWFNIHCAHLPSGRQSPSSWTT